jgi:hypothetical protein
MDFASLSRSSRSVAGPTPAPHSLHTKAVICENPGTRLEAEEEGEKRTRFELMASRRNCQGNTSDQPTQQSR